MDTTHLIGTRPDGSALRLTQDDWRRHVYTIGKTGTGKSTLLENWMHGLLASGGGFCFLDPHGQSAEAIADAVPAARTNDVLYIDPSDPERCPALNVLENVSPDLRPKVAANVVSSLRNIFGESWGPRMEYILTNSLRLLLDNPGSTLLGLPKLLTDRTYRTRLLQNCVDLTVEQFWLREFDSWGRRQQAEAVSPIQNKIGALLSPPSIRNIVGQKRSTFSIPRLMNEGKVLIVNLSKGRLGEDPAHFLGALFATAIAQAAEGRATIPQNERRDFTLFVDEFQNFATDSFATILSEARKYRLSLVLAHQFMGQVPEILRKAVLGNAGTIIAFRIGAEDAGLLAKELDIAPGMLLDTANFHAFAKLIQHGTPSNALAVETFPSKLTTGRFKAVQANSRACHTRPRAEVERRIDAFLRS
ncbi:type IV secretory system conjugative DNA transfer family protein [Rhodoferax sp.]|uniref:type IV secretory system conjugative DNA transfer family protein n=1 Tax=Rhodoferax sp. TaxID=50421 RepID=UPI00275B5B4A|nr:type IV secretion system DNA-binding domain-containing protein [Rhodoferax sp.]